MKEIKTRGWSLDNPAYIAISSVISGFTNIPLDSQMHILDNSSVTRNEQFFNYVFKDKVNLAYLSGYSPEL